MHATLEGEYTTSRIINSIVTKREDNASHTIESLLGPLIFTTNTPDNDELFVRTEEMDTPGLIVMSNIETCVGYVHIMNKVISTSITYDEMPPLPMLGAADTNNTAAPGSPEAARPEVTEIGTTVDSASMAMSPESLAVSSSDQTAGARAPPEDWLTGFPATAAGESEEEAGEGEVGSEPNLPVVIGVSAAVAVMVGVLSCICALCLQDSKLLGMCGRRKEVRALVVAAAACSHMA